jgi:hypothetical protein
MKTLQSRDDRRGTTVQSFAFIVFCISHPLGILVREVGSIE